MKTITLTFNDGTSVQHPLQKLSVRELTQLAAHLGGGEPVAVVQVGLRLTPEKADAIEAESFHRIHEEVLNAHRIPLMQLATHDPAVAANVTKYLKRLEDTVKTFAALLNYAPKASTQN